MAKYGYNKATLVGNLGKDPEVKYLDQGVAVATVTLATTERFKNREGQMEDRTEWHNLVMWRGLAETAGKYLRKGSTIMVDGRITNRSWDGPDGQKRYITEIVVDNMVMLDSRPQGGGGDYQQAPPPALQQAPAANPFGGGNAGTPNTGAGEDDLPF
jgi:single-strand DNA-binding protein